MKIKSAHVQVHHTGQDKEETGLKIKQFRQGKKKKSRIINQLIVNVVQF